MSFLSVSNIFSTPQQGSFILKDISFTQQQFQNIAVAGETGAGKTTLMKIVAGLIQPASGDIFFENEKVKGPDWQLIPGQAGIAYLSQHFELRNNYRMEELLSYANELPQKDAQRLYNICRIDHLMKRNSYELSGGEKQRIALARLLVSSPRLLILDEPFSNLDLIHKKILKETIADLSTELGITCMMASHDPSDILPWADEIIVLQNGSIIQQGSSTEIYSKPVNQYAAALFGSYNIIRTENGKQLFIRPENLIVTDKATGTLQGKVSNTRFMGSYYEITLNAAENSIIIYSNKAYEPGEQLDLSYRYDDIWFI